MSEITIARYMQMRPSLDFEPAYQREGGVWPRQVQSRLIDSIINGFDIPKLYFERPTVKKTLEGGRSVQYAVLDGKQRLEAVAEFIGGSLGLPDDFVFYENESEVRATGFTFANLQEKFPPLAQRVLDFRLPIVRVVADDEDLIEELFQRLNAATALNHAERRNAVSGLTREAVNDLAGHELLKDRSPIRSSRYKHRELATKFLAIEHQIDVREGRLADTKASTLMALFVAGKGARPSIDAGRMGRYRDLVTEVMDRMATLFESNDYLLRSVGTLVVYYLTFRDASVASAVTREKLQRFETLRREASRMDEVDLAYMRPANLRLREYNVFVQSTNDGRALKRRSAILSAFVSGYESNDELGALDSLADDDDPSVEFDEIA